jgi:hypothetical protein
VDVHVRALDNIAGNQDLMAHAVIAKILGYIRRVPTKGKTIRETEEVDIKIGICSKYTL